MARDGFKRRLARVVPAAAERSVYVLATALLLALAFVAWRPLPAVVWEAHGLAAGALLTICVAGWTLVLASTFAIDHFDLFGLRQAWLHLRGRPYTPVAMKSPRLYRVVRHPMMLGMLVALFATPTMTAGHLLFASAMGVYVLIGIAFEERALLAAHGEAYARYRREVPMLLPLPRRSSPGGGPETSESSTR